MTLYAILGAALLLAIVAVAFWPKPRQEPEAIELTPPDARPLSDEEKVARAFRARQAMDEFLAPAIQSVGAEYLTALTQLAASEPWETGKITKLAMAQRVTRAVEQHIALAVLDGEQASQHLARAKAIAAMPEAKRRWIDGVGK